MTGFTRSPKVLKGAIIGVDVFNPLASVVVFQYNPESLSRSLRAQTPESGADKNEALRLSGPPEETIKVDIEVDAADQLGDGDGNAVSMGVYPALSSLEMLAYPKSAQVIANEVLAAVGIIEVIPPEAPLTLFVWGAKRVLPVRLLDLSITEEAFDPDLNPIRAKVGVNMRVLNYQDLGLASVGGGLFMVHQIAKEVMATIGGIGAISSLGPVSF